MYILIGYLSGIAIFLALAITKVSGYKYFIACTILSLTTLTLLIIFRLLASHHYGFWAIWVKRIQNLLSGSLLCLSHHLVLPQCQIIPSTNQQYGPQAIQSTATIILWKLFKIVASIAITIASPLVILIMFFFYGEALYYQFQYRKKANERKEKRQEQIARQSARMTLNLSSNKNHQSKKDLSFTSTLASTYPYMQPAIVKKNANINNFASNSHQDSQIIPLKQTIQNQQILVQNEVSPYSASEVQNHQQIYIQKHKNPSPLPVYQIQKAQIAEQTQQNCMRDRIEQSKLQKRRQDCEIADPQTVSSGIKSAQIVVKVTVQEEINNDKL